MEHEEKVNEDAPPSTSATARDEFKDLVPKFSRTVGFKGRNRVRVYRERVGGPIAIEWWVHGERHRESLGAALGKGRIYSRATAEDLASVFSAELAKKAAEEERASARRVLGQPDPHTVKELLAELHRAKKTRWKPRTAGDSKRFRAFWERHIGELDVAEVTAHEVQVIVDTEAVREERDAGGQLLRRNGRPVKKAWSPRTRAAYLRYIVDAFFYAQQSLKWIDESGNLSGVKFPKVPKGTGKEYDELELAVLIPATRHPDIDIRCAGITAIIDCSGRRVEAVQNLRVVDVRIETVALLDGERIEVMIVRFDAQFVKENEAGEVPLTDWARAIVAELLQKPAVRATGLLFPSGDLEDGSRFNAKGRWGGRERGPVPDKQLNTWLRQAERLAGVNHIPHRAYHGMKRSMVTLGMDVITREQIADLTGTDPATLAAHYRKQTMRSKVEAMLKLEAVRDRLRDN